MLSLQQTQRFADVLAAAELVRRREQIRGQPSLSVSSSEATAPRIASRATRGPDEPDINDPDMPARYQVLLRCPFCGSPDLEMRFDQDRWALDHMCSARSCPWGGRPLPFRIVDEEIYRSLPTVVLGTLDKAASISMQAAMRGFYGPPSARCPPTRLHVCPTLGKAPNGCLFPGCSAAPSALGQDPSLYAPTIRMQDELHLLRDSLGAVDAHYEALLDSLQAHFGPPPKIIASSATLAGHSEQVAALYRSVGTHVPPTRAARRPLVLVMRQRSARAALRRGRPTRRHTRVRDRPAHRGPAARHPACRRRSSRRRSRDRRRRRK